MKKEIYTRKKLAKLYHLTEEKVADMLESTGAVADGQRGGYLAYTVDTFVAARTAYYRNHPGTEYLADDEELQGPLKEQLQQAKLRKALADAERAELDNLERKNTLISRKSSEDFYSFLMNLFASRLKEILQPEAYNATVQELYTQVEEYITEKGLDNVISTNQEKPTLINPEDNMILI